MAGRRSDLTLAASVGSICLMLAGCGPVKTAELSYTSRAASVDDRPDDLWGEPYPNVPPQPNGRLFDPTSGLGVQRFADQLTGGHVDTFVAHRRDLLRSGAEIHDFYPPAKPGPGPGMCEARRFQVAGGFSNSRVVPASDGKWLRPVYAVAGSLAPLGKASTKAYWARLARACRQRSDMDAWFDAEPKRAYLGARLIDAVVAAAKHPGSLPFGLHCLPYPPEVQVRPLCAADVRRSIASLLPRAILSVGDCNDRPGADCISVQLAKAPERSPTIEDRWTVDIRFDASDGLAIKDVTLADTQPIID